MFKIRRFCKVTAFWCKIARKNKILYFTRHELTRFNKMTNLDLWLGLICVLVLFLKCSIFFPLSSNDWNISVEIWLRKNTLTHSAFNGFKIVTCHLFTSSFRQRHTRGLPSSWTSGNWLEYQHVAVWFSRNHLRFLQTVKNLISAPVLMLRDWNGTQPWI